MRHVIIIGSQDPGDKNNSQVITSALQSDLDTVKFTHVNWEDLVFTISKKAQTVVDAQNNLDIATADLVIMFGWYKNGSKSVYRDIAYTTAIYCYHKNVSVWNSEALYQRSTTKLSAMMIAALNGIDVPYTIYSVRAVHQNIGMLSYPLICKSFVGRRGSENYLVQDEKRFRDIFNKEVEPNTLLVQEFIPNDYDLRIICVAGQPQMVLKRSRIDTRSHLNNTSQGGSASEINLHDLDSRVLSDVKKISKLLRREICGIDILVANDNSGRHVFLEANTIPQLSSGVFVDKKMQVLAAAIEHSLRSN